MNSLLRFYFKSHELTCKVGAEPKILKEKLKKALESEKRIFSFQSLNGNLYVIPLRHLEYIEIEESPEKTNYAL